VSEGGGGRIFRVSFEEPQVEFGVMGDLKIRETDCPPLNRAVLTSKFPRSRPAKSPPSHRRRRPIRASRRRPSAAADATTDSIVGKAVVAGGSRSIIAAVLVPILCVIHEALGTSRRLIWAAIAGGKIGVFSFRTTYCSRGLSMCRRRSSSQFPPVRWEYDFSLFLRPSGLAVATAI
jgi:hypothetical protein